MCILCVVWEERWGEGSGKDYQNTADVSADVISKNAWQVKSVSPRWTPPC